MFPNNIKSGFRGSKVVTGSVGVRSFIHYPHTECFKAALFSHVRMDVAAAFRTDPHFGIDYAVVPTLKVKFLFSYFTRLCVDFYFINVSPAIR